SPKFCNVTAVGFNAQPGADGAATAAGALLRRGTAGAIANSIITDFKTSAVTIDDDATLAHACAGGTLTGTLNIRNSIQFANGAPATGTASGGGCTSTGAIAQFGLANQDPLLDGRLRAFTPPFTGVPAAGSPAGTLPVFDCATLDPKLDDHVVAGYIG